MPITVENTVFGVEWHGGDTQAINLQNKQIFT
jgi:hypothetical protein